MIEISLTSDQNQALQAMLDWMDSEEKQFLTIGGYAGTGKTTLIGHFRKELPEKLRVAFCSYTGKATNVLKQKLGDADALQSGDISSTIHKLIYEPVSNDRGQVIRWEKVDHIPIDLIIIDEGSMIDKQIWEDLKSFGKPILVLGDHGQLPPVTGSFNLMDDPDIKLKQIVRQAEGNPIITLSRRVRKAGEIPALDYGEEVQKIDKESQEAKQVFNELVRDFDDETLIMCGLNRTRVYLNDQIRNVLGFKSSKPEPGDRVVCLRNNYDKKIFNGMLGEIVELEDLGHHYQAEINMDDLDENYNGKILKYQFNQEKTLLGEHADEIENQYNISQAEFGDLFDFGYVLTVHKAQGSEADIAVVFEERIPGYDRDEWRRWLYTAVTRAREKLYIFA